MRFLSISVWIPIPLVNLPIFVSTRFRILVLLATLPGCEDPLGGRERSLKIRFLWVTSTHIGYVHTFSNLGNLKFWHSECHVQTPAIPPIPGWGARGHQPSGQPLSHRAAPGGRWGTPLGGAMSGGGEGARRWSWRNICCDLVGLIWLIVIHIWLAHVHYDYDGEFSGLRWVNHQEWALNCFTE